MSNFNEMIAECNKVRQAEWTKDYEQDKRHGEHIYAQYVLTCIGYEKPEWIARADKFASWLKKEKIKLNFYQRKWIAENHFGYKYEYNYEKEKWECRKV